MQSDQHIRREAAIEHARAMLVRLKTLDQWHMTVRPEVLLWAHNTFGSLTELYERTVAAIQQQIDDPCSTTLLVRDDGSHEWVW